MTQGAGAFCAEAFDDVAFDVGMLGAGGGKAGSRKRINFPEMLTVEEDGELLTWFVMEDM